MFTSHEQAKLFSELMNKEFFLNSYANFSLELCQNDCGFYQLNIRGFFPKFFPLLSISLSSFELQWRSVHTTQQGCQVVLKLGQTVLDLVLEGGAWPGGGWSVPALVQRGGGRFWPLSSYTVHCTVYSTVPLYITVNGGEGRGGESIYIKA